MKSSHANLRDKRGKIKKGKKKLPLHYPPDGKEKKNKSLIQIQILDCDDETAL